MEVLTEMSVLCSTALYVRLLCSLCDHRIPTYRDGVETVDRSFVPEVRAVPLYRLRIGINQSSSGIACAAAAGIPSTPHSLD